MEEYINFFKKSGILKKIFATNEEELDSVLDSMSMNMNSDMSENMLDKMIDYFKIKNLRVGFIVSLEVYKEHRGKGSGSLFMKEFEENIMNKTDVDILLARTENKQLDGFNLEQYYESQGFKGVALEYGDMLMVSKGYEKNS